MMTETKKCALDQVKGYDEKIQLMVLSVLREECGRELAKKAHYENSEFDWETHRNEFNADYGNLSTTELLKLCKFYYGLKNLDEVRNRRDFHRKQFVKRTSY